MNNVFTGWDEAFFTRLLRSDNNKMGLSSEERALAYTLCAFTAAGIMFNIILLIWHCVKFKAGKNVRYIKYAVGGLNISYIFTGLAVTLLILYSDLNSEDLCKIGGFLSLFASQESLWMLATSCLVYLLWIRTRIPKTQPSSSEYEVTNKWSVPIFILILIVKCILLAIVSFLPMTNIAYFSTSSPYYYLCVPVRIPHEQGWPYSTLIVTLNWIALFISIGNLVAVNVMLRKSKQHTKLSEENMCKTFETQKRDMKVEFTLNVSFGFNGVFWTLILLLLSINYFSGGQSISRDSIQWAVGFLVSLLIVLHPVLIALLQFIMKTDWFSHKYFTQDEETFKGYCPKKLENVQKLASYSQVWYSTYLCLHIENSMMVTSVNFLTKLKPLNQLTWSKGTSKFSISFIQFEESLWNVAMILCNRPRLIPCLHDHLFWWPVPWYFEWGYRYYTRQWCTLLS